MLPLRIVSFKFRPMHVIHVHPRAYTCITNKKSLVNITWSELGKQNTQAKKVYSGFHAVDSGLTVLDSRLLFSGTWTPDSNRFSGRDSGFLQLNTGFQSPGIRIPQERFRKVRIPKVSISRIPESGLQYTG